MIQIPNLVQPTGETERILIAADEWASIDLQSLTIKPSGAIITNYDGTDKVALIDFSGTEESKVMKLNPNDSIYVPNFACLSIMKIGGSTIGASVMVTFFYQV